MKSDDHDRMVASAIWHVEHLGCAVLPLWGTDTNGNCRCRKGAACAGPGKHPYAPQAPNGVKDAMRDAHEIDRILADRCAYGLTPPTGVVLFDLDGDAATTWARLVADHGPMAPSWGQTTRHGRHEGYVWPAGGPADPGGDLAGIVTRRSGTGYVVGPYSQIGGHVYTPDTGPDREPHAFAELPTSMAAVLATGNRGRRTGTRKPSSIDCLACGTLSEQVAGSRYAAILTLTMRLHAKGHADDVKWDHVRDHLAPRLLAPLSEVEVRARFERATADSARMDQQARTSPGTPAASIAWPEPEDRGSATLSEIGAVEYVEDLIRPGRIVVWAAEEGSGKSFAVSGELAIRVAIAGGVFAGIWPIVRTGPVLYLSEMHGDDDHNREETVLGSLELVRTDLVGRLYRLSLMTAAGGPPALQSSEWCARTAAWLRDQGCLLLIIDTATAASQVDPWGPPIQAVYGRLHAIQEIYPALAIVLVVHVKKPTGQGGRRISDVLGEWGRWCDVVVMQENDGTSLERTKLTVRKRVRQQRRILAIKSGGLLVDPVDLDVASGVKVPVESVIAAVEASPGLTYAELGTALGVSKDTASRYIKGLGGRITAARIGPRGQVRVYMSAAPPQTTA